MEQAIDPEMEEVGRPELGTEIESSTLHIRYIAWVGYLNFLSSESEAEGSTRHLMSN